MVGRPGNKASSHPLITYDLLTAQHQLNNARVTRLSPVFRVRVWLYEITLEREFTDTMDAQRTDVTSCYNSDFDAKNYLQTRFSQPRWHQRHILKWFGEFFQTYLTVQKTHIGATDMITMVEISGGPCVANMLVATPYVSTIVFSDYLPQNIRGGAVAKE